MNQIFLEIGNFKIYWYSIILLIAFSLGISLAIKTCIKEKIEISKIVDYFFYMVPLCLIGARIYYVLFNLEYYSKNIIDIFKVWEGGLAIHGGIIVGVIFTIYYTKRKKINFWQLVDILCISLILGQIIGRWGNFMNSEAYGPVTTYSTLHNMHIPEFIIKGMKINGVYHHPTFLYESLWNLIGLIIILITKKVLLKLNKYNYGTLCSMYLIWYGIGRFFIEGMRQDSLMFGSIRIAQLVSIISIVSGMIIILYVNLNKRVKK